MNDTNEKTYGVLLTDAQEIKLIQIKPNEDTTLKEPEKTEENEYIKLIYKQMLVNEVEEKYANQIISEIESTLQKDAPVDTILTSIYQKIYKDKICKYFDIPIQHISNKVLKRMNRKSDGESIRNVIKRIRQEIRTVKNDNKCERNRK